MGPSSFGRHIKDKPCAKQRARYSAFTPAVTEAFLEMSDPRTQKITVHAPLVYTAVFIYSAHVRWDLSGSTSIFDLI
jgi:hypothetical protein